MIRVLEDADAVADAAAQRVAIAAHDAIAAHGTFRVALSGGTTPAGLYRRLASSPWRERIEWPRVTVLLADERAVAPDDHDRNLKLIRDTLLVPLGAGAPAVRAMRGEAEDLDAAARDYEAELDPPPDLLVLGVGPDGHTASLFPGRDVVLEIERRCVAVFDSPKPPPRRLTITPRVLLEAHAAIVLVTGSDKAAAVAAAHHPDATPQRCPAAWLSEREWLIDRAASLNLTARAAGS